jgi:hypothetical protein
LVEYYINFKYNLELVVHMLEEILKGGRKAVATGLALAMLSLPTCWRDQSTQPTPDPEGTVVSAISDTDQNYAYINLNFRTGDLSLSHGTNNCGAYCTVDSWCGHGVSYNKHTTALGVCTDDSSGTTWIAGVGPVDGLGDVKSIPSSGHVNSTGTVIGNGYVVALGDGTYARLRAERWHNNTGGGIIGVEVKWQTPFNP